MYICFNQKSRKQANETRKEGKISFKYPKLERGKVKKIKVYFTTDRNKVYFMNTTEVKEKKTYYLSPYVCKK